MLDDQYIFEEWDSMCAKAHKDLQGNCPLIEDEVLVEMHKYVGEQDIKIKQLLSRVTQLEQAIMSNCYDDPSTSGKRLMALVIENS